MNKKQALRFGLWLTVFFAGVAGVALGRGVLWVNTPSRHTWPVRGVNVSSRQGEIDWPVLAGQDIQFAYIQATEGAGAVDARFAANLVGARRSGLRVGACHLFRFDGAGAAQAANFIAAVPLWRGMLPPAVALELYGDYRNAPPPADQVRRQLGPLLERLEQYYGAKPLLYATPAAYELYLAGQYEGYDVWIQDVWGTPRLPDGRDWTFWQYSRRQRLEGYGGEGPFIDMNVFYGTAGQFAAYGKQSLRAAGG